MPRIGTGLARGRWQIVRELVEESLTRCGTDVTVYDPPNRPFHEEPGELTLGI